MNHKNKIIVISVVLISILALTFLINKLIGKGTYSAGSLPSITLSCTPNEVTALGEVNCNVVLDTNGHTILGLSANYITSSQINYVSYSDYCTNSNCFETIASTTNGFATGNINGVSGSGIIIGKIKVNMTASAATGNSYSIGINNIELSDDEFNLIQISGNVTTSVSVVDDTNYVIIKYNINGGTLGTEYDSQISIYNNYVMLNNEYLVTKIAYGNTLGNNGLVNYNNSTYLNVKKSGYAAKDKAEWNTKVDGTGISYNQKTAYSSNDFCDASNNDCEVTLYVNWVPDNIEAVLDIDSNSIIKSIPAETTLESIMSQIETTESIVLYDNAGNVKEPSEKLKTGDYITITSNGTSTFHYISVIGDVNGDGNVNEIDVAKLFQHYRGTTPIPANQQYYIVAGDVVPDNTIKLTDVAKLFQYFRGIIKALE